LRDWDFGFAQYLDVSTALREEDIQLFFLDPFRIVQGRKINASAFRLQLKPLARFFLTSVISLARIHH
jgi:hypothetical protein